MVCLVPASTDTQWWHTWVMPLAEIRFLQGRLKFSGSTTNAPFPCAVVIFGRPLAHEEDAGHVDRQDLTGSAAPAVARHRCGRWCSQRTQALDPWGSANG